MRSCVVGPWSSEDEADRKTFDENQCQPARPAEPNYVVQFWFVDR